MFPFSSSEDVRISRMNGVVFLGLWTWRVVIVIAAVIAIIWLFQPMAALVTPGWLSVERSMTRAVVMMVGKFRAEYGRLPLADPAPYQCAADARLESRGRWMDALLAKDAEINPRAVSFFPDMPLAEKDRAGLLPGKGETVLVDSWGNLYAVIFDMDGNNQIANPEFGGEENRENVPEKLERAVILYSGGPDGKLETWADNIRSWRYR